MKRILTAFLLICGGCATYEMAPLMEQPDMARANWKISFWPQYVALRQRPIPMPDEFLKEPDVIKSQVEQYGFITGWDFVISGCGATLAGSPDIIMMSEELSSAYMLGYSRGVSNAADVVRGYYEEKKDSQQPTPPYSEPATRPPQQ